MERFLQLGVLVAGAWAIVALTSQVWRGWSYGRLRPYARPAGSRIKAVAYALGPGMLPGAKESVREHLPAYFTGLGYHLGIGASLYLLAGSAAGSPGALPGGWALHVLQALTLCGAVCGAMLLLRRARDPQLRALSHPDDVVANLLTTAFATLAFGATLSPWLRPWWMGESMCLLLYAPLGKIRHCCFFFVTRCHMASFFGRRGVLPPAA